MSLLLSEDITTDWLPGEPDFVLLNGRWCFWTGKTAIGIRHEGKMAAPLSKSEEWLQNLLVQRNTIPTNPSWWLRLLRLLHLTER